MSYPDNLSLERLYVTAYLHIYCEQKEILYELKAKQCIVVRQSGQHVPKLCFYVQFFSDL